MFCFLGGHLSISYLIGGHLSSEHLSGEHLSGEHLSYNRLSYLLYWQCTTLIRRTTSRMDISSKLILEVRLVVVMNFTYSETRRK